MTDIEILPPPQTGTKLVRHHGPDRQAGIVSGVIEDSKIWGGYIVVARFWFKRRRMWHIEAIDGWSWSYRMGDGKDTIGLPSGAVAKIVARKETP